ncbi:MAG: SAP domain-containing protein [Oscillospiraceae bacterium]|nr:SAP domain-containing protein [Oscillospiraceae bacterium]
MKTIQMIKHTYGYRKDGKGTVAPKTPKDPPFEVSDSEAERLVTAGVAKYTESPDEVVDDDVQTPVVPKYGVDSNGNTLKELLKAVGLPVKGNKEEMVTALDEYYGVGENSEESELSEDSEDLEKELEKNEIQQPSLDTAAPENS